MSGTRLVLLREGDSMRDYMANGTLLEEIRKMVDSDAAIPPIVRDKLILAAIADLYQKVDTLTTAIGKIDIAYIEKEKGVKEEEERERKKTARSYLQLTVGTAISALVVLIINGIIYFVKILPIIENSAK